MVIEIRNAVAELLNVIQHKERLVCFDRCLEESFSAQSDLTLGRETVWRFCRQTTDRTDLKVGGWTNYLHQKEIIPITTRFFNLIILLCRHMSVMAF